MAKLVLAPLEFAPDSIKRIRQAIRRQFSPWFPWSERVSFQHLRDSGVYILGHLKRVPAGPANPLSGDVIYIGETGASFTGRWNQFNRAADGRWGHGGGDTYHQKFTRIADSLHVAALPFTNLNERDAKVGRVLYEHWLLYEYLVKHGRLPDCNTVTRGPRGKKRTAT